MSAAADAIEQRLLRSAKRRFAVVAREIIARCEAGELIAAVRPIRGGIMTTLPSYYWNGEGLEKRFVGCQMSLNDPFGEGATGEELSYIFLQRESLLRFLLSQPFIENPLEKTIHLSPYLRVLVAVAQKLQITIEKQPKKEVIVAEIRQAWTGPDPLGETLVAYMATILREPESQLGRGRNKNNA